ncbi:MAG: GNAT family N-acetyltransferase [Planctomycetota bacterium]
MTHEKGVPAWQARPAAEEEISTLIDLFNTVYHKNEERDTLEWKYLKNPHGRAIIWVAESEAGEIVGSVAFMPRRIRIQGQEFLSHHGADAMVLPEWQRGGILITLLTEVYRQCWERGDALVHIFPNRRSVGALRKMGLHPVSLVQEMELSLRGRHLFRRYINKAPFLAGLIGPAGDGLLKVGPLKRFYQQPFTTHVERIDRFDEALAEVGMTALAESPVHMVRDKAFLNWRYVDNPTRRHRSFAAYRDSKPVGYLVMETAGGVSYISDLLALDLAAREDLLAIAVLEARQAGAEMLQCMSLDGDGTNKMFRLHGFRGLPDPRLVPLMINVGPLGEACRDTLIDATQWYTSHGDRDVEHMTP